MRFRIARELGGMTVYELGERMYSDEETEWWAVFELESEEYRAARAGRPPPAAPLAEPTPDEVQRRIELAFPVTGD